MTYTVVGFTSGIMDTIALRMKLTQRGQSKLISSGMKMLTVHADDFWMLAERFGERFVNFVLLNDAAIEVCKAVDFPITPFGTILGTIEETEIRDPLPF